MTSYDTIVLGLGGMGSATAYQLARRGQRVLGLERHTAGHAKGASHGLSRVIRQSYFEDPAYVPLLLRAYELWEQVEAEADAQGRLLHVTGGLMMGTPESEVVSGSIHSAREWGLPHEIIDAAEIRRRFPQLTPDDNVVALYEAKAGWVHPEEAVLAHLRCATALGAELHFEEPATSWEAAPSGDGVRVTTAQGTYTAARLVITPGPWAPGVLAELGLPLRVERAVLYWFAPKGGAAAFAPDRFPIYIWEIDEQLGDGGNVSFYGFPAQEGAGGSVKASFFRTDSEECTPETIDRTVHEHEIATMRRVLASRIPALDAPCTHSATCMYTMTPDQHFVIAHHPAHEQVTIGCGFSGHGYKFASAIGEVLADLAADGRTRHDIALFRPERLGVTP